jgi:antitoxin component YwqK of YwqJK toxin-antitoxin module
MYGKLVPLFLFCIVACTAKAPNERVEYFDTGQPKSRVNLVNGKKEGKMIDYYPGGKIRAEREFQADVQMGKTVFYYPDGQVQEVQYYRNGAREKGDSIWYPGRALQFAVTMQAGKKNGYLRKWDESGNLIYEAKYSMDTLIEVNGEPLSVKRNPTPIDPRRGY